MKHKPTEREVKIFTEGDCWALAGEVNRLTGWQIVAVLYAHGTVMPGSVGADWYHMAVRMTNGRVLDVRGPQREALFLNRWQYGMFQKKGTLVDVSRAAWEFEASRFDNQLVGADSWQQVTEMAQRLTRVYG